MPRFEPRRRFSPPAQKAAAQERIQALQQLRPRFDAQAKLDEQRFAASASVLGLKIGSDAALLCQREGDYELMHLNETAHFIWEGFAGGGSRLEVTQGLEAKGASAAQAREFVDTQLKQWLDLGFLTPREVMARLADAPIRSLRLALDETCADLHLHGEADQEIVRVFSGLTVQAERPADVAISVVDDEEGDYIFVDGQSLGRLSSCSTVPRVKAALLEGYLARARGGFCTHAALVAFKGRRVVLTGPPGAGKSTLALALVGDGFGYGGDDTARVGADGRIKGLPFPATIKAGAWPLLARWHGDLASLAIHERLDGQSARYLIPERSEASEYGEVFACLRLERRAGVCTHLETTAPLDALCALLESAYTEHPAAHPGPAFEGLARILSQARCGRLVYDDLGDAVRFIKAMLSEAG